ncbi:MAG: hypothetical protein AAF541_03290 [Pseudomonadota bacterium]
MDRTTIPTIVDALITGGHEGTPELILKIEYENGVVSDVTMENEMGVKLLEHCGVDELPGLIGEPWNKVLEILDR